MLVLSIDQSLSCSGYCIMDENENIIECGLIKTDKKMDNPNRLLEIYNTILNITDKYELFAIIIEESYFAKNVSTLKSLNMVRGVIELLSAQKNIPLNILKTTECRKEVLGKGNAKKDEVYKFVSEKYKNINFETNDMTDAVLIATAYIKTFKKAGVVSNGERTQTT